MRPARVNVALLAVALSPLVYGLCANLVTGGSFAAALQTRNLWVFPFLIASGAAFFIFNYMQFADREKPAPPNKRVENFVTTVPAVERVVRRRALEMGSGSDKQHSSSDEYRDTAAFNPPQASQETLDGLVAQLFAQPDGEFGYVTCTAAWKLAALMGSDTVRAALHRLKLTDGQLSQPRLKWFIRPGESSARSNDSLNVVQGRIGYVIRESGVRYLPPPPLTVDPYIAAGLIAVRDGKAAYHSGCLVDPHGEDADLIDQLYGPGQAADSGNGSADARASRSYLAELRYRDLGKLIRLDLPHTNPQLAAKQVKLISHVMRHFLDDGLSAVLFDALSPESQIRLAATMLTASQWMSPADWEYWARTGRDPRYAAKLEAASDSAFAAACGLAVGIIVLACWQIVAWISNGWSWYFGSSHFLMTSPGWLKAFLILVAAVFCSIALMRITLGMAVVIAGVIGLALAVLASPVVRIHTWIASWETASTLIICVLISSALLAWLGISYADRRNDEVHVQLSGVDRGRFSQISQRSRFHPDHDPGHDAWCKVSR